MKKSMIVCMMVFMSACGHRGSSMQVDTDDPFLVRNVCEADTIWAKDSSWCDIQRPFVENGRQVLYCHITFYDGDTQVMDYVYIPRGSAEHARRVKELFGDTGREPLYFDDLFASHGSPYTHVDLGDLPRDWFVVMHYKGTPVLTADYPYYLHITDSTLVHHGMEDWVEQLRGVEKQADGSYVLSLIRFAYGEDRIVAYRDSLPPLDSEHLVYYSGWRLTTREHLPDFDLIDIDGEFELVDPLASDYRI